MHHRPPAKHSRYDTSFEFFIFRWYEDSGHGHSRQVAVDGNARPAVAVSPACLSRSVLQLQGTVKNTKACFGAAGDQELKPGKGNLA
jgi:hypothetical protein